MTVINSVTLSSPSAIQRAVDHSSSAQPQYIQALTQTANRDFVLHLPPQYGATQQDEAPRPS